MSVRNDLLSPGGQVRSERARGGGFSGGLGGVLGGEGGGDSDGAASHRTGPGQQMAVNRQRGGV